MSIVPFQVSNRAKNIFGQILCCIASPGHTSSPHCEERGGELALLLYSRPNNSTKAALPKDQLLLLLLSRKKDPSGLELKQSSDSWAFLKLEILWSLVEAVLGLVGIPFLETKGRSPGVRLQRLKEGTKQFVQLPPPRLYFKSLKTLEVPKPKPKV